MTEANQHSMISLEEEKQHEIGNGLSAAHHENVQVVPVNNPDEPVSPPEVASVNSTVSVSNAHAEAGRKGARRIHQLIQQGRQYEREHSLKPGRQRLRQLIEEGKLYEQEHGLRPRKGHRPRMSHEQTLKTFLQSLLRVLKPAYRAQLLGLMQALEAESK
jgi:hypothetical protein